MITVKSMTLTRPLNENEHQACEDGMIDWDGQLFGVSELDINPLPSPKILALSPLHPNYDPNQFELDRTPQLRTVEMLIEFDKQDCTFVNERLGQTSVILGRPYTLVDTQDVTVYRGKWITTLIFNAMERIENGD